MASNYENSSDLVRVTSASPVDGLKDEEENFHIRFHYLRNVKSGECFKLPEYITRIDNGQTWKGM